MKKCKRILIGCMTLLLAVSMLTLVKKEKALADTTYCHVTFDYNYSRVADHVALTSKTKNDLKTFVMSVENGATATTPSPNLSEISPYYTLGWTVGGNSVDISNYVITRDTTFVAEWTPKNFVVQFKFENEEVRSKITNYVSHINFTIEDGDRDYYIPNLPNYTFLGWFKDGDIEAHKFLPAGSSGDKSLTARFTPTNYVINYHDGSASFVNPRSYTIEDSDIKLMAPTKTGHIFKGWFSDAELTRQITTINTSIGGNIDIYPLWELEKYDVTFVMPDGSLEVVVTEYGNTAELPDMKKSIFELVKTDVSRDNITGDTIIRVSLVNIWYVYVIGVLVIAGIVTLIVVIKKKRNNAHNKLRMIYHSNSSKNTRKY